MKILRLIGLVGFVGLALAARSNAQGSLSGGGGNLVALNPASAREIAELALESRPLVVRSFNMFEGEHRRYISQKTSRDTKLFDAEPNVFDVLKVVALKIERLGPCISEDGKKGDGASRIISRGNYEICISPFEIEKKKRSRLEARAQVVGLLAHEVSHLLDLDESQAEAVATRVVNDWRYLPGLRSFEIEQALGIIDQPLSDWRAKLDACTGSCAQHQADEVNRVHSRLWSMREMDGTYFPFFTRGEGGLAREVELRINNLYLYACTTGHAAPAWRTFCAENLKEVFGANASLNVRKYDLRVWALAHHEFTRSDASIKRIASLSEVDSEIVATQALLKQLTAILENNEKPWSIVR